MSSYDDPQKLYVREKLSCRIELKDRVFAFDVQILGLDAWGMLVNQPDLAGEQLVEGQAILVRYFRTDSAYQFISKVVRYEEMNGVTMLRLSFPSRITRYQRRKNERTRLEGTVEVQLENSPSASLRGYLRDVSAGGVRCSLPLMRNLMEPEQPPGRIVNLSFMLLSGERFPGITAKIRRIAPEPGSDKTYVQVQFVFEDIQKKLQNRIQQIVLRNQ